MLRWIRTVPWPLNWSYAFANPKYQSLILFIEFIIIKIYHALIHMYTDFVHTIDYTLSVSIMWDPVKPKE